MPSLVQDPIVVFGAPRSGTTYLQQVLDRHPEIALTNEVRLFEWLHRALSLTGVDRAVFAQRDAFVEHLRTELPAVVRRFYASLAPGARWWGDKNPHYAESEATLQTIRTLFPGARFVHIVRDPRAVVASLLRKRHDDGSPWTHPEKAHGLVGTSLSVATSFRAAVAAEACYELRYEDLVADDEAVARALLEWLEIPCADEVVAFCRQQSIQRTPVSGPTTDLAAAGDRSAARSAWAATVPAGSRRQSLEFLAPYLLQFGYETEASLRDAYRALPGG